MKETWETDIKLEDFLANLPFVGKKSKFMRSPE
jgi:hypothetical protein